MDSIVYEVSAWGAAVGDGVSQAVYCTLEGVAKIQEPNHYVVANEYICGRLGLALGLPVPPGVVVTSPDQKLGYVSLRFGPRNSKPPPADAAQLVAHYPRLAADIVLFDCWVANADRHKKNLAYVPNAVPPTLFDHSHALFGPTPGEGITRLKQVAGVPIFRGCVVQAISEDTFFAEAQTHIQSLPDDSIRAICEAAGANGSVTPDEASEAATFLIARKSQLLDFVKLNQAAFPSIQQWSLI